MTFDADKATIAVRMTSHRAGRKNAADQVVRYVHEGDKWKVDDIRGAVDDTPWSIRDLLIAILKRIKKC